MEQNIRVSVAFSVCASFFFAATLALITSL
jgi:hypothetical protein